MKNEPITDVHELVKSEVVNHMKPFVTANFEGQERLYRKMDKLECVVKQHSVSVHDVIQYGAIVFLFISVVILFSYIGGVP